MYFILYQPLEVLATMSTLAHFVNEPNLVAEADGDFLTLRLVVVVPVAVYSVSVVVTSESLTVI